MSNPTRIFVYGTLKRGCSNHHFIRDQKFVAEARTLPQFILYNLGGYPGMVRDEKATEGVIGEVWEVDDFCLRQLDLLEGLEVGEYERVVIPLEEPFDSGDVQGYVYLQDVSKAPLAGYKWPV